MTTTLDMPSLSFQPPTPDPSSVVPETPRASSSKGKRKADEVEGNTPPDSKKATFAPSPRPIRASNATTVASTHAPSSYHRQKRARLSTSSESRPGSRDQSEVRADTAATVGSWASRKSIPRPHSRSQSVQSHTRAASVAPSRRSLSQASIPISALISPHAPSIARSGHTFHMRDPHKLPRIQPTGWSLSWGSLGNWRRWTEAGGSPLHAWLFFLGFVLFPVWWVASFLRVLRTRRLGKGEDDSQVVLDDPQLEFDARTWRTRCRIMAGISFFTYVPFVVLVAVFARR
ncbi:hypothetical protein FB45DRAFT_915554 [Roridomyces roridus]|uniref:Uncharacterized protein n=1 Tax=Roridomyces roridus TaxID=1738132 RepID=A0AAD7FNY8_9AGAR|nr:hypothetical protein FB45DRAFT_915554 [Roridomyces roridus]